MGRKRRSTTWAALVAVPTIMILAACAPLAPDRSDTDDIATYRSNGSSDAALVTGTLVSQDGCVYIDTSTGEGGDDTRTLPFFPEQTTVWDGTTLTTGDETHALGDIVSFGGGVLSEPTSPRDLSGRPGLPDACDATYAWTVAPPR